jgi:acetyl-CoA synthetase
MRESALGDELKQYVKSRLAKHEYPREVEFVSELLMTTTGKIIRKALKTAEAEKMKAAGPKA